MKNDKTELWIDLDTLPRYGENTARLLETAGRGNGKKAAEKLKRVEAQLEELCKAPDLTGTDALEWLRDNRYILRRDTAGCCTSLRQARRFRKLQDGRLLICAAMEALVLSGEGIADESRTSAFLAGFQKVCPLEERELCLLPQALRYALICRLKRYPLSAPQVFRSLKWLNDCRISDLLERLSPVDPLLRQDPAGVYGRMDPESRQDYRHKTAELAARYGISEPEAAGQVLELAQAEDCHVGEFLYRRPLGRPPKKKPYTAYLAVHLLLPLVPALALAFRTAWFPAVLLVLPSVHDAVKFLFARLAARCIHPRRLPRLDYSRGIPAESRTLAVSAVLLTDEDEAAVAAKKLELFRLANRDAGENLLYGLLADLKEGDSRETPEDKRIIRSAADEIRRLNDTYGGGFCLLHRFREYSPRDKIWRGRERKRGAVMALTALLRGKESGLTLTAGDGLCLKEIRYLIVLDGDTMLNAGSAVRLAGAMAHPLQRWETEADAGIVRRGYGILQPKISVSLEDAQRSDFARIFAGQGGLDPYGSINSDVYQDIFGEGSYTGKGILDVDAFQTCLQGRFPPETLLSHDLIEGGYLGCAFLSDVELTDGFPAGVLSYFERQHRWIRGDWQTLPWLFPRVKDEEGRWGCNPLTPLSKRKILDNLIRSITPVAEFLTLLLCGIYPSRAHTLCLGAVLLCLTLRIAAATDGQWRFPRRYRSRLMSAAKSDFIQLLWLLLLLPYRAWIHGSAILLALYRSLVSHKRMLAWVTASEGDKSCFGGIFSHYRRMWPCIAAAIIGFLCPWVVLKALGLLWLITPALCRAISRPQRGKRPPTESERQFLLHCGGDIARYYAELVTPERHWLPPDNFQETPLALVAERTSPTNIGLWLLSALAAGDLGIWPEERSWACIGETVHTLQLLPRFRGHFYNWYDILRCEPLQPPFISTVDSGNLLACLIVLREAAVEVGKGDIAESLETLIVEMKLDFLYDGDKELLRIGWDPTADKPAEGCYDLLESEARITSFLAVARGEAPRRHWRRLDRTLADAHGMSGMASWTGTMFEYLMPTLFMPSPEGSLLGESQEFCLHAQKKLAFYGVWGMSESAFAARDAGDNYAYKAHGVQALALKHGMDREAVITPYAAFLALEEDRRSAVTNLQRLRTLGAEGRFGFYEALDFTTERLDSEPYQLVRCFMSHHLGMSLLAIDNCLMDGIMQRRFMADPANLAFRELLEEKTPVGQRIRPVQDYLADPKPEREKAEGFLMTRSGFDSIRPVIYPLSGGPYSLLLSELGGGDARCRISDGQGGVTEIAPHNGVFFFAGTAKSTVSLQPLPELRFREGDLSSWDGRRVRQYSREEGFSFCLDTLVPETGGEVRSVTVKNESGETRCMTLAMYLEPILCPRQDYEAHPAFHRLCLESSLHGGKLVFTRRGGGTAPRSSLGIACTEAFEAETDKEQALGRGGMQAIPMALSRRGSDIRASSDPCALLRIRLELRPGEEKTVRFSLATAAEAAAAAKNAEEMLRHSFEAGGSFRRAKTRLRDKLSPEEAVSLLTPLFSPKAIGLGSVKDKTSFWRFGISGDLPVAFGQAKDGEKMLAAWAFLRGMGTAFDLAIDTEDEGVYGRPAAEALRSQAAELGLGAWEDKPGGFHFIGGSDKALRELKAAADAVGLDTPARCTERGMAGERLFPEGTPNRILRSGSFAEEGFLCRKEAGVGVRAWSLMLSNGSLGWLAADTGCGNLWLGNAREQRLTPWLNDPLAIREGEEICLLRDGRSISLMADADDVPTELLFGFGFMRWRRWIDGTEAVLTGFIPPHQDCRYLILELHDKRPSDKLYYRIEPVEPGILSVAAGEKNLLPVDGAGEDGSITLECPAQESFTIALWTGRDSSVPPQRAAALLKETKEYWRRKLASLRVETPSPALDAYLNGWAIYQTLACRLLGRCSLYQSGGAYGFRDQLQDICALIDFEPELARKHILLSAAHQYEEGDVMHWWHPGQAGDKGVRTRCSDDLLWLPYACTLYVQKTGDEGLWEEKAPWLCSPELRNNERDRYETPQSIGEGTIREHCLRVFRQLEKRGTGPHGLPLMGAGDWNDGFDRVEGESVWLGWFAALVLDRLGTALDNVDMRAKARELGAAAEAAWHEGHYLRGYYADGRSLGAEGDGECALDSLSQSFAVLSGFGDPRRSREAVVKASRLLLDRENKLVKLFSPPFNGASDPGYIRSYLPGVRENGGQYTHGGVWLAAACLRCGETELGWEILETMLPSGRQDDVYQLEPFVIAADVYANPDMIGRGGWSWYTGAAGWFLRVSVEELLGVKTKAGELTVEPKLPAAWSGYRMQYRAGGRDHLVNVARGTEGWETDIMKSENN